MLTSNSTAERLEKLREVMRQNGIHAFIVPTQDAHQSEYIAPCDARRAFISGFTGSAGTAVVTLETAALWTDGRYYLQAAEQLDANWKLMKHGLTETPSKGEWLLTVLPRNATVGVDAALTSVAEKSSLEKEMAAVGIAVQPFSQNFVDLVWNSRPKRPCNPIVPLDVTFAGRNGAEKLADLQQNILQKGCDLLIVNALDEIAWLLNARGCDIAFNPVFFAFAVISLEGLALFVDGEGIQEALRKAGLAHCTTLQPYDGFYAELPHLCAGKRVLIGRACKTVAIADCVAAASPVAAIEEVSHSPLLVAKAVKNDVELAGFRSCHVRDGAALVAFFAWLEDRVVQHADRTITEVTAATKLSEFRAQQPLFRGESFETISAYGSNGAIIHYDATLNPTSALISTDSLYLCDSGGQYSDGTTDVTRTLHFGRPTPHQIACYTAVLRGHVDLAMAKFPEGVVGSRLDTVARLPLWSLGLDYRHGTGHGVGHCLNVHEGPHSISYRAHSGAVDEAALRVGMTVTNEPGYYEAQNFGIRIENVMAVCSAASTPHSVEGGSGSLAFETLTMAPYAAALIDVKALSDAQIRWIDAYHAAVRSALMPLLQPHNSLAADWLHRNTEPLVTK